MSETLSSDLVANGWEAEDGGFYNRDPISLFIGTLGKGFFIKAWAIRYPLNYRTMGEIVLTPENIDDLKELFKMPFETIDAYFDALQRINAD